jgi:hypothetical protein
VKKYPSKQSPEASGAVATVSHFLIPVPQESVQAPEVSFLPATHAVAVAAAVAHKEAFGLRHFTHALAINE